MGVHDFTETVSCFMRVAWAAAAGKLHLLSSPQPIRETATAYSCGRRSRQSSTGKLLLLCLFNQLENLLQPTAMEEGVNKVASSSYCVCSTS